jgi:hypothetical protein
LPGVRSNVSRQKPSLKPTPFGVNPFELDRVRQASVRAIPQD